MAGLRGLPVADHAGGICHQMAVHARPPSDRFCALGTGAGLCSCIAAWGFRRASTGPYGQLGWNDGYLSRRRLGYPPVAAVRHFACTWTTVADAADPNAQYNLHRSMARGPVDWCFVHGDVSYDALVTCRY